MRFLTRVVSYARHRKVKLLILLSISVVILSVLYVFVGNNVIEDEMIVQKQIIGEYIKDLDLEGLQKVFKEQYGVRLLPIRKIELTKTNQFKLNYVPTQKPLFDIKMLFLVQDNKIEAIFKKDGEHKWERAFKTKISHTQLIDANRLLVVLESGEIIIVKRDSGEPSWSKSSIGFENSHKPKPLQISFEKDRRLFSSTLLIPQNRSIVLYDILDGEVLAEYRSLEKIAFISEFDVVEKCLWLVEENNLIKVVLNVN